jgi:MerR family transcriptional regulator, thiopeptide resistance regulator
LAGVSVRTLHHYDSIGLLVPQARTAAGYRLYSDADLLRLQQILIGRELGLSLEEIRRSLDDARFDLKTALLEQRERLKVRARHAEAMVRAIEVALAALDGNGEKGIAKMENLFEGFNPAEYDEEVRRKWGQSEAFVESTKRTAHYTSDDWKAVRAEQASIYDQACAAMRAGKTPSDGTVMDIAERHRLSIERWFYPCTPSMHRGLASMYEGDDRFRQTIDEHGEGLTVFFAEAIRANARRRE